MIAWVNSSEDKVYLKPASFLCEETVLHHYSDLKLFSNFCHLAGVRQYLVHSQSASLNESGKSLALEWLQEKSINHSQCNNMITITEG